MLSLKWGSLRSGFSQVELLQIGVTPSEAGSIPQFGAPLDNGKSLRQGSHRSRLSSRVPCSWGWCPDPPNWRLGANTQLLNRPLTWDLHSPEPHVREALPADVDANGSGRGGASRRHR